MEKYVIEWTNKVIKYLGKCMLFIASHKEFTYPVL